MALKFTGGKATAAGFPNERPPLHMLTTLGNSLASLSHLAKVVDVEFSPADLAKLKQAVKLLREVQDSAYSYR